MGGSDRKQRPHKPRQIGPRLYRSPAGYLGADFRYLGRGRLVLRNPRVEGWTPDQRDGEATTSEEVARGWVTDYERAFRAADVDRQLGKVSAGPRLRLEERIEAYLKDREKVDRVSPSTYYNDQGALRLLVSWFGPEKVPEEITTEALQQKMNARLREGAAASSCRTTRAHLSRFFDWLEVPNNPARKLKVKGPRSLKKFGWSREQIEALRTAADAIDQEGLFPISARYAFELALNTGVREGELFGLEGSHINERTRTCKIVQQSSRLRPGLVDTKGGDAGVAIILPEYWAHHRPGVKGLLLTIDGKQIRTSRVRNIIDAVIKRAGLKQVGERNHMTRHTFARLFLEEYHGDLRDLQKFLRHKSLRTTEVYYGHYSDDVAIERVNERIYGRDLKAVSA